MKEKGVSIPEIALYDTMTEKDIFDARGNMRIKPMQDVLPGVKTNNLTSLPAEISKLKNLRILFIANTALTELPDELAQCEEITDIEIYNCPDMKKFPTVISQLPKLTSANLSANPQWEDVNDGLRALGTGLSAKSLQIIYLNECSLTILPAEINNMKKLGMLSAASNKIHTIESAYPDISFVQLFIDDNEITEIPHTVRNGKRMFFRIEDVETFSCTYIKLSKFPDIFDAESIYGMSSVDFSYNQITEFENQDADYQGIYVATLSLANNPGLKKFPKCIAESKSKVDYINVRGCGIEEIPEGSFKGENTKYLVSLDLSYNKLKDFPREFTAASFPYFYGIDLSYNQFASFPYEPFDCASLTMFALRGQRNAKGERCLTEWPTGVYNHTGLRALYLGSNDLGKINDTISYLIYYLDISDNPNIVFDASDICYNWLSGTYFLLYDKTQKILNCDEMLQ
jgi:Leucine-rich repeat (LRR) protein